MSTDAKVLLAVILAGLIFAAGHQMGSQSGCKCVPSATSRQGHQPQPIKVP